MNELEEKAIHCIENLRELEDIIKELIAENYRLKNMIKVIKDFNEEE